MVLVLKHTCTAEQMQEAIQAMERGGAQSITPARFDGLMCKLAPVAQCVGRCL